MCTTRFIASGIGNRAKLRPGSHPLPVREKTAPELVVRTPPSAATGRRGEACRRDTPAKTGRPGPYASEHTRQGGGAIAGRKRHVPACVLLRTRPGEITCLNAEGTLAGQTDPGRRERCCLRFWATVDTARDRTGDSGPSGRVHRCSVNLGFRYSSSHPSGKPDSCDPARLLQGVSSAEPGRR